MQAEYVMRVQVIKSKKQPPRFYVNIPLPLAAALDLQASEEVQWQLIRSDPTLAAPQRHRSEAAQEEKLTRGFFSRIKYIDPTPCPHINRKPGKYAWSGRVRLRKLPLAVP